MPTASHEADCVVDFACHRVSLMLLAIQQIQKCQQFPLGSVDDDEGNYPLGDLAVNSFPESQVGHVWFGVVMETI